MRREFKKLVERVTGLRIFRSLPRGILLFDDLRTAFPRFTPGTVFDVGANVGDWSSGLIANCSQAKVFAFEPVQSTFSILQKRFQHQPRVQCFNLGLGAHPHEVLMTAAEGSTQNKVVPTQNAEGPMQKVTISTVDHFCSEHSISQIDFLKIDTEGFDLQVLEGAQQMLTQKRVLFVQAEVGMHPQNNLHVSFESVKQFLESRGFFLFALYEQTSEFHGDRRMRRTDVVFMSDQLV